MLKQALRRLPSALVTFCVLPVIARDYFRCETGREYGIGLGAKLLLLAKMVRNNLRIVSASNFITHLLMASRVLNVSKSTPGVLVECGCYKGGSTANLSLVAKAVGRRLHVFDSFRGLPAPEPKDTEHIILANQELRTYDEGAYSGTYEEVSANISRYGAIEVCDFHIGFFEFTLCDFKEPTIFAYLDVDLMKSEKTCLRYLWPRLAEGAYLYTDEAHHHEIAKLFYDEKWWRDEFAIDPPGLVGAGNGVGLFLHVGGFSSGLGYTMKVDRTSLTRLPG